MQLFIWEQEWSVTQDNISIETPFLTNNYNSHKKTTKHDYCKDKWQKCKRTGFTTIRILSTYTFRRDSYAIRSAVIYTRALKILCCEREKKKIYLSEMFLHDTH